MGVKNSILLKILSVLFLLISSGVAIFLLWDEGYNDLYQFWFRVLVGIVFLYSIYPFVKVIQDKKSFWDVFLDK